MSSPGKNNAPPVLYIRTCKKIKKHDSLLSKYLCPASNPGAGFLSKCKDHLHSLGKMSLFTAFSGKGSITVETAAVLPLFLLFFLSLSVFFQTLHVQSRADLSLMQSSREMAVLQYGAETGGTDQPGAAVAVGTVYAQGKLLLACPPAYQKQKGIVLAGVGMPVTAETACQGKEDYRGMWYTEPNMERYTIRIRTVPICSPQSVCARKGNWVPKEMQMEKSIGDVSCAERHKIAATMCSLPGRGTGIIPIWDAVR